MIEARDFTLVIQEIPASFKQYKDELSLKFAIWRQIQNKFKLCKERKYCSPDLDTSIVEINFGLANIECLVKQRQVVELTNKVEVQHVKMMRLMTNEQNRFKKNEEMAKIKKDAIKAAGKLQHDVDILKIKFAK